MEQEAAGVVHVPMTRKNNPRGQGIRSPLCSEDKDFDVYENGDRLATPGVPVTITCPKCLDIMSTRNMDTIYHRPTDE